MKKQIIISSKNKGKIKEIQEILDEFEIISIDNFGIDLDIKEDGKTFEENAIKKVKGISEILDGKMVIADDLGIEIDYLDGFPGVNTNRWFNGTDREKNLALIEKLDGVEKKKRKVKFVVVLAFFDGCKIITATGEICGYITEKPRGNNGFGFDEIFELEDGRTLAELSSDEKNKISARRKAIELLKDKIIEKV